MKTNPHQYYPQMYLSRYNRTAAIASVVVLAILASACAPEENLDTLLAQRDALDEKIKALQSTSMATDVVSAPVTTHTVVAAPFEHTIDVRGSIQSRTTVQVTPRTPGTITKLTVANGQFIAKGALIAELDAELTRRGLEEVETQLELATTLYERQKRIYDAKAGSEIQYLQARSTKESLERRIASLREQLEVSKIYAPVSGIVDGVLARVGENVAPGVPMLTIVNTADMRVIVDLSESYVRDVNVGDRATIIINESGDTISASIGTVAKFVNPISRTFAVEIPLTKVPATLRPNMTAVVRINDVTVPQALSVPLASIVRDGDVAYVNVVGESNVVTRKRVETGMVSRDAVQIVRGIEAGEHVVVNGTLDVASGQRVRIIRQAR